MVSYSDILSKLKAGDYLFEINFKPLLFSCHSNRVVTLLQFKNSKVLHEESENHFAIFFSQVEKVVNELSLTFATSEDALELVSRRPEILDVGTLLATDTSLDDFIAISRSSTDKISRVHNLVNYLIPVCLNR